MQHVGANVCDENTIFDWIESMQGHGVSDQIGLGVMGG